MSSPTVDVPPDRRADFIEFLWNAGVVTFGDFVAKSGRPTPYFVNSGHLTNAAQLDQIGTFYAEALDATFGADVDVIFGPAYKGITLAVTTGLALHRMRGRAIGVAFDRKEAKDHGEGGWIVGHQPQAGDRVVLVEDVTTAGTSVRATVPRLNAIAGVKVVGLVVGVDRQERGRSDRAALQELADEFALTTCALATVDEIVSHLGDRISAADRSRIAAYRATFGAR